MFAIVVTGIINEPSTHFSIFVVVVSLFVVIRTFAGSFELTFKVVSAISFILLFHAKCSALFLIGKVEYGTFTTLISRTVYAVIIPRPE
uniref:Uncharacterized protein n=1 Tax=Ixodes ricinus TaxID=34613 RepID=A0A6B0UCD8_IXORI